MVHLESAPPQQVSLQLTSEEHTALVLEREETGVAHATHSRPAAYAACEAPETLPASPSP